MHENSAHGIEKEKWHILRRGEEGNSRKQYQNLNPHCELSKKES